ncbi:MAG: family 43 glycosylhydrolase [Deltaproteobacteria bacterium]|nr:family 43 glycosylhydrolase [Deltaproteobacteria bacterium]
MKTNIILLLFISGIHLACANGNSSDTSGSETDNEQNDADSDGDSDTDSDSDSDGDSDSGGDSDGDSDTDADSDTDGDTDTDGDSDSDGDADADTQTDSASENANDTDDGTDSASNSDSAEETDNDTEPVVAENPVISVLNEDNADPEIMYYDGMYYIYPTTCPTRDWLSTYFKVYSSFDMVTWEDRGIILDSKNISWGNRTKAWAPTIQEKDGVFYFYFCLNHNIGVATSASPTGPFVDALGHPLVEGHIDPDVFIDDDGQAYLYYGQTTPRVRKLAADMISFEGSEVLLPTDNFREGVYVFKRDDRYYMMGSENDARDETYQVTYSIGTGPMGPFVKQPGLFLSKNGNMVGTGHNSVIQIPGTDNWFTAYHRHFIPGGGGQYREVCIQNMTFNEDGAIASAIPGETFVAP